MLVEFIWTQQNKQNIFKNYCLFTKWVCDTESSQFQEQNDK